MAETHTLIIGVGNADCGDDGAGLAAAELLRKRLDDDKSVRVILHWGESTGLVDAMTGWDRVLIIDAANAGADPGSYRIFNVGETALPSDLADMSSHGFGIPQAIELARALGTLPNHCHVYGIEGAAFDIGTSLSPVVNKAVETVAAAIMQSLEEAAHA